MPHTITVSEDASYVILEITGEITSHNIMGMIMESHALGRARGITRHLVDATHARNTSTVTENYRFAYKDAGAIPGLDPDARVAMLVSPEDHSHDFIETVTQNSGYNTRLFRDRKAAVDYLLQD